MQEDDEFSEEVTSKERFLGMMKDWGIALALTAIGFILLTSYSKMQAPDLPGQAPSWKLENLDGEVVSLEDFRGKTVVLNFWATWCGPCRTEIPTFSAFAEKNPDIPVFGIAVDGTKKSLKRAADNLGITYPVLIADAKVKNAYKVSSLPTTVVVDPEGHVRDVHVGIMLGPQLSWATR